MVSSTEGELKHRSFEDVGGSLLFTMLIHRPLSRVIRLIAWAQRPADSRPQEKGLSITVFLMGKKRLLSRTPSHHRRFGFQSWITIAWRFAVAEWQYRTKRIELKPETDPDAQLETIIRKYGQQGWELVQVFARTGDARPNGN
ncbi:MAG: hypothetical protein ABI833_22315 [Acidobacteriota bacterium]